MTGQRTREKCGGCAHVEHRDQCPAKGPSTSTIVPDPATGRGIARACGRTKQPCPCAWGWCHDCGQGIVGASTLPLYNGDPEIDVDRGSAGDPAGLIAVWILPDSTLAARRLAAGEQPGPGEWRGREHACKETPHG
jgi:hypothetical protein